MPSTHASPEQACYRGILQRMHPYACVLQTRMGQHGCNCCMDEVPHSSLPLTRVVRLSALPNANSMNARLDILWNLHVHFMHNIMLDDPVLSIL